MRWLLAAVTSLILPTAGCGRVGYELLPAGGRPGTETGASGAGGTDASTLEPGAGGRPVGSGGIGVSGAAGAGSGGAGAGSGGAAAVVRDAASDVAAPGCGLTPAPVTDYCATVPELPGPVTIDGELDCGLALRPLTPMGWTGGAIPPDATAEYAVAWRLDGLYFYVLVHDPRVIPAPPTANIWEGDGVELFVDSNGTYAVPRAYDLPGTRQFTTAAPGPGASVARGQVWAFPLPSTGELPSDWLSTTYRAFPRPGGYALEAFVVGADLGLVTWSLAAGDIVGMDVAIDVSYSEADASGAFGHRLGQYFASVDPDPPDGGVASPFVNTQAFCNPMLVSR